MLRVVMHGSTQLSTVMDMSHCVIILLGTVKANFGLDSTVDALDHRALLKHKWGQANIEKDKQKLALYTNTDASRFVTQYAELNAHDQCKSFSSGKDAYWIWKRDSQMIWVMLKKHSSCNSPGSDGQTRHYSFVMTKHSLLCIAVVTRFVRVRTIRIVDNSYLTCDCHHFMRHGFPCRHMYVVLREIAVTDFDIRWHLQYYWDYRKDGCEEYTSAVDDIRAKGSYAVSTQFALLGHVSSRVIHVLHRARCSITVIDRLAPLGHVSSRVIRVLHRFVAGITGPRVNDMWETYMVDRIHGVRLNEEGPIKLEFTSVYDAELPVTVSPSGLRWDSDNMETLTCGEYEIERSVAETEKQVAAPFDPTSTAPFLEMKAVITQMANLTYKYSHLHENFMKCLNDGLVHAYATITALKAPVLETGKGKDIDDDTNAEWVSSNVSGLNEKGYVKRFGF